VQLEVPATLDGLTYPAGTALTVDADLNWVAVTDLGAE
jgi:hypothetical protein